ncbi:MFS transporter [Streptacidiphilus sp. N1-10]|uniref:MFS transporter n=1 Tax=Streptacidiphilus jeojiensis TaxID=3229225 RepID=A0ABV6XYM5_9ACTN
MFSSYRRVFVEPGTVAFALTGLLARFPMGMTGVAAVFMITGWRHSYSLAGSLAATVLVVVAVAGPQISRLMDRHGQARVAVPAVLVSTAGGFAELLCLRFDGPGWLLFGTAAVTGLGPNIGTMSRARWAALYRGDEEVLHSAYALEAVIDEICFILGPLAATMLATTLFPAAGFLAAGVVMLLGTVLFCAQRRTEPPVARAGADGADGADGTDREARGGSALRSPGLRVLVLTLLATGGVFGVNEITVIGFADHLGHKAAASLVLACYALGSCLSGLAFGLWKPKGAAAVRLPLCLLLMTALLALLPLVGSLPTLAAVLFGAGLSTAPTMVTGMGLVRDCVPPQKLNEGFGWAVTGLLLGVSGGAAVGGWAVQHLGPGAGFRIPAAMSGLALLIALLGRRGLAAPAAGAVRPEGERSEAPGPVSQVQ